ncbi:MAG: hypothetical protein C5B55_14255 [Blastocatellia bacterium]|nr:MAG: hypothetical protein C5B55_14255 [Blastocatellia bacterium]
MRRIAILFLIALSAAVARSQTDGVDPDVRLEVSVLGNQTEFRIGETIPLQLAFSSKLKDRYQINMAQYDRSGRMNYEKFNLSPADGFVDPLPSSKWGMGGLTNFQFLTPEHWTIKLNLNEWVRFTQAGEFRLVVFSDRVGVRDPAKSGGTSDIKVQSNEIKLKIIEATAEWQKEVFNKAVAALNAPEPRPIPDRERYFAAKREAIETLRFLGTVDSTRELAKRLTGDPDDTLKYVCSLGLIASPQRDVARTTLAKELADPDHAIDGTFLYTFRMVSAEAGEVNANWREEQHLALESLINALPAKRGKALSISLSTAVNEAWNDDTSPQRITDALVKQLVSLFDQLPLNEQNMLLDDRWSKIAGPAMLPLLRKYAQRYRDFPEMRESNAYDTLRLSGNALRRWYELDPVGARPAIIAEISRPRPRFDARVLGMLPDKTWPAVDTVLAEHLASGSDLDGSSNLASLIARYATDAILSQVTDRLDPKIGKWACSIQNPLLAYVLRVNPDVARPRIERAIAARGQNFTACNHELFQIVSQIHYDPVLEDIGIRSLDDSDPEVAMTAATMLGQFGSQAAESALWRRFETWSQRWVGHESELDLTLGDRSDERRYQLGLGQTLVQAIATGRSWFSDKSKLDRLTGMSDVRQVRAYVETDLAQWEKPAFTISLNFSFNQFHADVAQYELHSLDDLKNKLVQFPRGSNFMFSVPTGGSSNNESTVAEIRDFLTQHGFTIVGP